MTAPQDWNRTGDPEPEPGAPGWQPNQAAWPRDTQPYGQQAPYGDPPPFGEHPTGYGAYGQPAQPLYQQPPAPGQYPPGYGPQYAVAPYGRPGYPVVAPKSPALAALASFLLPGLGSMLNGEVGKGIGILVGYAVCWMLFWMVLPLIGAFALWVWGMVDAYQGAQRWNLERGIVS